MKSIIQTFTTQTLPQDPIHGQLIFVSDTDNMLIADKTNNVLVWREYTSQSEYVSDTATIPSYPRYLTAEVEDADNRENRYDGFKDNNLIYVLFDEWDSSLESNPRTSQPIYTKSNIFSRKYTYKAPDYVGRNWGGVSSDKNDLKDLPHSQFEAYTRNGMSAYYPKYEGEFQKGLVYPCYKDNFGYAEYAIWAGMVYLDERGVEDLESNEISWNLGIIYNWRGYDGYGGVNGWKTGKYPCWYLERFEKDATNNTWYKIQYFLIADKDGQYFFKGFKPYGGTDGIGFQSEHGDEKSSTVLDIPLGSNFWGLSTTVARSWAFNSTTDGSKNQYIYLTPEPSFSHDWTQSNSNGDSALFFDDRLNIGGAGHKEINGMQYRTTSFHISPIMLETDSTEGTFTIPPLVPTGLSLDGFEHDSNFKPGVPKLYSSVEYNPDTNPGSNGDVTLNIILKWEGIKATNENLLKVRGYHNIAIRDALDDIQRLLKTKSQPWDIIVDIFLRGDELADEFYEQNGYTPPESDGPLGVLGTAQTIDFGRSRTNDLWHTGFNDRKYIRPKHILITLDPADLFQPDNDTQSSLDTIQGKQLVDKNKDASQLYWVMIHELLHALGFSSAYFLKDYNAQYREFENDIFPNTDLAWKQSDNTYWYRGEQGLNQFHTLTKDPTLLGIPMGGWGVFTATYPGGSSLIYRDISENHSIHTGPSHYVGDYDISDNNTLGNLRVYPNTTNNPSNYRVFNDKKYLVNQREIMNGALYVGNNSLITPVISPVTAGILNDVGWIVDYSYVTGGLNNPEDWVVDA